MITSVYAETIIDDDTVITKENIYDVLSYLGISSEGFIFEEDNNYETYTAGELRDAVNSIKEQNTEEVQIDEKEIQVTESENIASVCSVISGTKNLTHVFDNGSYTATFSCVGSYSAFKWTGASSASCSANPTGVGTVAKVKDNSLELSNTPYFIYMDGSVVIGLYVGIGSVGLLPTVDNTIDVDFSWRAVDYL